eukprot:PhF_6_TR25316/c0_g1_i3/m.34964
MTSSSFQCKTFTPPNFHPTEQYRGLTIAHLSSHLFALSCHLPDPYENVDMSSASTRFHQCEVNKETWEDVGGGLRALPPPRTDAPLVSDSTNNILMICGGRCGMNIIYDDIWFCVVHEYDYEWHPSPTNGTGVFQRRYGHTVVADTHAGNTFYVFGGTHNEGSEQDVFCKIQWNKNSNDIGDDDPDVSVVQSLRHTMRQPNASPMRMYHNASYLPSHNSIVFVGGVSPHNPTRYVTGIHMFSVATETWRVLTPPSGYIPRMKAMSCSSPFLGGECGMLLFHGVYPDYPATPAPTEIAQLRVTHDYKIVVRYLRNIRLDTSNFPHPHNCFCDAGLFAQVGVHTRLMYPPPLSLKELCVEMLYRNSGEVTGVLDKMLPTTLLEVVNKFIAESTLYDDNGGPGYFHYHNEDYIPA